MGFVAMKCPSCGANFELDETREFGFCNYCGTKVMQEKTVIEHRGSVKIDGPIKIDGPVKIVDNKYTTLFANAKNFERLYFSSPERVKYGDKIGYNAVIQYYADAEKAGGSAESEYWESLADFFEKANVESFKKHNRIIVGSNNFFKNYEFFMDNAIAYATDLQDEKRLERKKEKKLEEIKELLQAHFKKANKYGAVYTVIWLAIGIIATIIICGGGFSIFLNK